MIMIHIYVYVLCHNTSRLTFPSTPLELLCFLNTQVFSNLKFLKENHFVGMCPSFNEECPSFAHLWDLFINMSTCMSHNRIFLSG